MEKLRQRANGLVNVAWRQKYVVTATALFLVGVCIVVSKTSEPRREPEPVVNYVEDYFITKSNNEDKSRFNSENTSMFEPGLLAETQRKWIVWKHNASATYNLDNPGLADPSMGQAAKISEIFKNMTNGFFIECGAYDGETRSNTLFFERYLNWTGLLIEADPSNFAKLVRKNRKASLSNTCLSPKKHPITTYFLMADNIGRLHLPDVESKDLINTADVAHHGGHVETQCLPLATYVAAMNVKRVDYFSLDIEGLEMEILETIPFKLLDIKTLSVEFSHGKKGIENMTKLMEKWGYEVDSIVAREDNLANDIIFVKKGFKESFQ